MRLITAISPILLLILMLAYNLFFFEDPMAGPNQSALLITALFGSIIAYNKTISIGKYSKNIFNGISDSIKSSLNAMLILLIIFHNIIEKKVEK